MTTSPSDTPDAATGETTEADEAETPEVSEIEAFAGALSDKVGGIATASEHDTIHIRVERDRWVEAVTAAAVELPFFAWLSGIDWAREVTVGEPAANVDDLEERFEVLCRLSSVTDASAAILVTTVPKEDPSIDSIVGVFPGAGWHEREAAEMFGIDFVGNPNLSHLYLPDSFEGHPLRKSFPLLSREVKPWPGTVDVEDMPSTDKPSTDKPSTDKPSTENTEAAAQAAAQSADSDGGDA